eukprot:scaffold84982_cov20-Tisochrysis_lutea.AAC.4
MHDTTAGTACGSGSLLGMHSIAQPAAHLRVLGRREVQRGTGEDVNECLQAQYERHSRCSSQSSGCCNLNRSINVHGARAHTHTHTLTLFTASSSPSSATTSLHASLAHSSSAAPDAIVTSCRGTTVPSGASALPLPAAAFEVLVVAAAGGCGCAAALAAAAASSARCMVAPGAAAAAIAAAEARWAAAELLLASGEACECMCGRNHNGEICCIKKMQAVAGGKVR